MTQRRHHTKSRLGCAQCKKNRTKCDEQKPNCGRCRRTGATCSLSVTTSALVIINETPTTGLPVTATLTQKVSNSSSVLNYAELSPPDSVDQPESIDLNAVLVDASFTATERDRLRLVSNYTNHTSKTVDAITGLDLWQYYVPELAFEHDFLLHGILSLSALHLAITVPQARRKHSVLAINHHNLGSSLFRQELTNITAYNVNALFAFAGMTTLYSFGIHRISHSEMSTLAKMHEILTLMRGTAIVVKGGSPWLFEGPFKAMSIAHAQNLASNLPAEIDVALGLLSERIQTTVSATIQSDVYATAITTLRQSFVIAKNGLPGHASIILFPVKVDSDYLRLLCIGEPLALAILAQYAVLLHWMGQHIWMEGWGRQIVLAIKDALPEDWYDCISWAESQVPDGMAVL